MLQTKEYFIRFKKTYHSLLKMSTLQRANSTLFTFHSSLFTLHFSLFTFHYSLFTIHFSLFTIKPRACLGRRVCVSYLLPRREPLPVG